MPGSMAANDYNAFTNYPGVYRFYFDKDRELTYCEGSGQYSCFSGMFSYDDKSRKWSIGFSSRPYVHQIDPNEKKTSPTLPS